MKLRAQVRNKRVVEAGHLLGLGADPQNLAQNLGQAEEALKRSGPWRLEAFGPVSQSLHPVEHADGDRLAADRAESRTRRRLPGFQANLAGAVAVQMILALLRKEFQGPGQSLAGAQGGYNLRVTQPGLEHGRLTGQVGRGVGVGGGDQMEAVQGRDPPVHGRIRAEARLSGVDVAAQILEALNQIVEARLGAQDREPGRPDVGRDQLGQGVGGQNQLQDVLGVQTQNGPAVRGQVAAGRQGRAEPLGRLKRGHQDDDVDFAHPLVLFVNTGDFSAEQEADLGLLPFGLPQGEEAFFWGGGETLGELLQPAGVGQVAAAHQAKPLAGGPEGHLARLQVPGGGPGEVGVDVQVSRPGGGRNRFQRRLHGKTKPS